MRMLILLIQFMFEEWCDNAPFQDDHNLLKDYRNER